MNPAADRPHVFRCYEVAPSEAEEVATRATAAARSLAAAGVGSEAWAVHLSHDRRRVITIEAWRDERAFRHEGARGDLEQPRGSSALYRFAGPPALRPLDVADEGRGVIAIDVFSVWRPLVRPVAAFNMRNGRAFHAEPGCLGTAVLRGLSAGRIATFARWASLDDFVAAFGRVAGVAVKSLDEINPAGARLARGLVRPDYHAFTRVAGGGAS